MPRKIKLELTPLEAELLESCAGNGWGDGDFGEWLISAGHPKNHVRILARALEKLRDVTTQEILRQFKNERREK